VQTVTRLITFRPILAVLALAVVLGATPPRSRSRRRTIRSTITRRRRSTRPRRPRARAPGAGGDVQADAGLLLRRHRHRVVLPHGLPYGKAASGPFFDNPSSSASNPSFTLLRPGTEGGLVTGAFQEPPANAFANRGDAVAGRIIEPSRFAGVNFSVSTAAKEAQTGVAVAARASRTRAGS